MANISANASSHKGVTDDQKTIIKNSVYASDIIPLAERIYVEGIEISPYKKKKGLKSLLEIFKE